MLRHMAISYPRLLLLAIDLDDAPIREAHRSELAAPDAARVERDDLLTDVEAGGRPVTADDRRQARVRQVPPGLGPRRRLAGWTVEVEDHAPVGPRHAQTRERRDRL